MRAIIQTVFGGPEVLHFADVPTPTPGPRDLLVRVAAVSINPVDAKVRGGGPAGEPVPGGVKIFGWDASGVVEAVGSEVSLFQAGDEVYFAGDIGRPGSYAEFVAVDERIVGRKPASLSHSQAAAVPLTALTAWEGIFEQMGVVEGGDGNQSILIVGGAGGVGSIAIQIAKRVAGLRVIATASRPESRERCLQLGADGVIDHSQEYKPQLQALGVAGVEYVFTTAIMESFVQWVACLKPFGKICTITGGPAAQSLDVSGLMGIRGTLTYELMFTRPRTGVEPERQGQILNRVADLLDGGVLETTLAQEMSWSEVQAAHRAIETAHTAGKIVLRID
jgi:NADPH:quinone reductase